MRRRHWFEIADVGVCPEGLGRAMRESMAALPAPFAALLAGPLVDALKRTGSKRVLDLCSGAGGPWHHLAHAISDAGLDLDVELTDAGRFPRDLTLPLTSRVGLFYSRDALDARSLPADRPGFRTVFNALHHLRPEEVRSLFARTAAAGEGIFVSEITSRRWTNLLWNLLGIPLLVLLAAPFTLNRRIIAWTYGGFLLPLALGWDGAVSCLRSHRPDELLELGHLAAPDYEWTSEVHQVGWLPVWVTCTVGVPAQKKGNTGLGALGAAAT